MSEISQRLRARADTHRKTSHGSRLALGYFSENDMALCKNAADEIDRLSEQLEQTQVERETIRKSRLEETETLRNQLEQHEWGRKNTQIEMDEREAEIDRLRESEANERYEAGMYQALYENAQKQLVRKDAALNHARVRFECLTDYFEEIADETMQAMSSVDADRMIAALTDEHRVYAGGGDGTFNENEPDDEFVRKARAVHTDEQQPQPRGSGDHRSF